MSSLNKKILLLWAAIFLCGQFVFAQSQSALDIAQKHLQDNAKALNLKPADLVDYSVRDNYVSTHNGVTHLYLIQRHQGIEVYNGMININILPDGKVLNVGNRFVTNLGNRVNTTTPQISAKKAVENVIDHFNVEIASPYVLAESERINDQEIIFAHQGIALEPIKTKLLYQPLADKSVRLAWQVSLYETNAQNWWSARIDALTGEVLTFKNQVIKCSFGSSADVCQESHNHQHTTTHTTTSFLDDDVNNAYNVIPLTAESPNHSDRVLQVAPADLTASPFGWHDTDGEAGHEFTITRGNNVHAYHDIFNQNGSSGDEPDGGDSLFFDFPFDETNNFPYTQVDAATTNLFYWNNLMHDIWYQYGFDEVSGNFQANNYANGGVSGDYVRAECLDGSGTNNANFGTGEDGTVGRMQMYFWGNGTPPDGGGENLVVTAPETVAGDYPMVPAVFGGTIPSSDAAINGSVVLVDDGTAPNSDACEGLVNIAEINGNIALIDRGTCEFGFKILAAENAGAIAAIICNNVADAPIGMAPGAVGDQVTIPAVMISLQDCNTLKEELDGLEISLFTGGSNIPLPGPQGIDGDFDNGIVCHEYGHGVSIRLAGGPSTGGCLNSDEQMGEGWSDWFGLVLSSSGSNNADEGRGIGTYASNQATTGGGIRTYRYSRNMTVNPHTYADINGESIPHGVGSVWCAMIWDLYWDLIDVYGYDEDLHNGTGGNNIAMQLVIDGLKLQACNPTFIDGRDAILAADEANYDGANQCLIWQTFARRGLGIDAQAGGNQNFDMPLLCSNSIGIEKTGTTSADVLDEISYTIEITNGTQGDLTEYVITDMLPANTSYVDGSSTCGGTVDNGVLTITVSDVPSLQSVSCTYSVIINPGVYSQIGFEDDLENGLDQWEISGTGAASWAASTANPNSGTTSVFAPDPDTESDQYFMIAESITLSDSPGLGFYHSYDTEATWDGGVVEIRLSGTNTWFDLGNTMLVNGYDGLIQENPASAISGRPAFNGNSGGYIYTVADLGLYSNGTVDIRFRFASDGAEGGDGWHVDDIQIFSSLVNIENIACVTDQDGDEICDSAETTVFGVISSNENITPNDARVALFPNPTDNRFSVEITTETAQNATIKVYTTDGRLVYIDEFNTSDRYTANMSKYGTGVYFAEIITNELHTVKKLIVR